MKWLYLLVPQVLSVLHLLLPLWLPKYRLLHSSPLHYNYQEPHW